MSKLSCNVFQPDLVHGTAKDKDSKSKCRVDEPQNRTLWTALIDLI